MGLLLSVLITCVGVLEVIACYTHFRVGVAYTECKSNIRDIARHYAVELRKHELHFEPGPNDTGPSTSEDTLSELMRKRTVRTQDKLQPYSNGHLTSSCTDTPDQGTPNIAANLKVPRNSVCGLDSPTVQTLISPELDITEAVEKIQNLENNDWNRKSPSPYPEKSGLLDNWNRSPSPFPGSDSGVEMVYTSGLKQNEISSDVLNKITFNNQESIEEGCEYSKNDLEVQNIMLKTDDVLFGITAETAESEETKFDEAFLRSLDGMKSSKCDDRRRSFRKKRNSSSTSSRASRDETSKSVASLDELDDKKISPLTEEIENTTEMNGHQIRTEVITPEKCESIASPVPETKPKDKVFVTKQEETLFEAEVAPNNTTQESSTSDKGKANLTITEKVKDLEISVQLLVTVKGTSQGDKMEYTTTVSSDEKALQPTNEVKEETTKTTEEKSEFGNVKTSITYGNSVVPEQPKEDIKANIKDLQISSQSLIHAERTVLDDVTSSEAEFLKLYESYTELPENQKDEFLKIINRSKSEENLSRKTEINNEINLENPPEEKVETITTQEDESSQNEQIEIIEEQVNCENPDDKEIVIETSKMDQQNIEYTTNNIINTEDNIEPQESKTEINQNETYITNEPQIDSSSEPEPVKETIAIKHESSSESSSTPSTVLEIATRRASKSSFEDATTVQNQEMKRRLSNTEISPKQASQAFWLIFSAEYTNAMEKDWHGQHFSCWQCDESLTGQRYVLRDDHPYCVKCYEQVFANPCEKCSRTIGIDSKDLSYKDKHWHEACFQCTTCSESLVDKQFGAKGEKIYCGNCYDKQFASRCDGCGKIFHAGTKKMEYKNRQWHEQCFKCCKCETPIGTKSFIPREKDIYCAGCYEEKFATRCVKCDKAIQSGGVTYKNEPWHRECFTCTHCNKNLAGQRFTSRDDKPCCAECFGRLFAKRCTSCSEPITGIGGTRFISFEDRHWHNDCFICASCSTSLVGRGFITDEDKIICPECAKERFM